MSPVDNNQVKMYNISCVICTDIVSKNENIVVIKCGHIFHEQCLRKWQMHQSTTLSCPTCRKQYTDTIRVYVQFQYDDDLDSPVLLENRMLRQNNVANDEVIVQLLRKVTKYEADINHLKCDLTSKKDKIKKLEIIQKDHKRLLSMKENDLKKLNAKLQVNAKIILELTNTVISLRTKFANPSAKLNTKNIELTKLNDDLSNQLDDLKGKLTAKTNELDRCQKAAAQKNKLIKELKEMKLKCNVPDHKNYSAEIRLLKTAQNMKSNTCYDLGHEEEISYLRTALMDAKFENVYHRFLYYD